jgi:hypothetical protein
MNNIQISSDNYTFIGTSDGRVLQYTKQNQEFLARLFSFPFSYTQPKKNAIKALATHKNLLSASGYGGEIILIDISTRAKKKHILKSKSTVSVLHFIDETKLISANVDGEVHIYNLQNNTSKKLVTTLHNVKQILHIEENNTLLVVANTNYIALIDLNKEIVLANKHYVFNGIVEDLLRSSQTTLEVKLKNSQTKKIKLSLQEKATPKVQTKAPKLSLKGEKDLLEAYERNDFKLCYESIDKHHLYTHSLALLLQKHWEKLMLSCEVFALEGEAKALLTKMDELLFIQTRSEKIGDLLRVSFFQKIQKLSQEKLYKSALNIIYSYIDIFSYDVEIAKIIKKFELVSQEKVAIFRDSEDRRSRSCWREYFHQLN